MYIIRDKKLYNILIIEDNQGDFTIIEEFLQEHMWAPVIIRAHNYQQALKILSGNEVAFDVILLDLSLPDKSGPDLVSEMLRKVPLCPVIILTGYTDIDFSIQSISKGIFDYLLKDELSAVVLYKSILYAIERNKIIRELRRSEKRASDLFNLSPQPMLVYDPETFKFIQVNKAAIDHYGYNNEEFIDMLFPDLWQEKDNVQTQELYNLFENEPGGIHKEKVTHRKKNGDVIEVELFSGVVVMNGKDFRSVIVIDVTERNLYEQKIIQAIIKTQEDERYEIGGELHDNVCQIIAASQMSLGILKPAVLSSEIALFDQCRAYLTLALHEIRNLSHRLAPAFFDDSNLEQTLNRLFNSFSSDDRAEIRFDYDKAINSYDISPEIQINLYRILQEQLTNIQKYANAASIEVDILIHNNTLKMRVSDDGKGFDVNTAKAGIGLANMRRRTALFSGKFYIVSAPGDGCTISIEIPLLQTKPNLQPA
ncbi:MAG: response regulator [Rhizobacter sp.]|nr:response regulator [Ferruginibacter sp.]